jgi:uncharacterized protein
MGTFAAYSLPILGLKTGIHQFKYTLDDTFFRQFEASPVQDVVLEAKVQLDKRPDMMVLEFELEGHFKTECDRCTASINMPVSGLQTLYLKYSERPGEEDDEVVFIGRDWSEFNLAKYLYEFSVLALPLVNTYDCDSDEEPPCNMDVLKLLAHEEADDDTAPSSGNPIWEALQKIDKP